MEYLESDANMRLFILTGSGKSFVAGADIARMKNFKAEEAYVFSNLGQSVFRKIEHSPLISIAGINGFALGGGLELALACDMRVLSEKAKVGLPEVSLGLIPGFGGTQRLGRLVGKGKAMEVVLSGEMYSAEDAYQMGIANALVSPEALMETCEKYAASILKRGPIATREAKNVINRGLDLSMEEGLYQEKVSFVALFQKEEAKEGLSAFLEKRAPNF